MGCGSRRVAGSDKQGRQLPGVRKGMPLEEVEGVYRALVMARRWMPYRFRKHLFEDVRAKIDEEIKTAKETQIRDNISSPRLASGYVTRNSAASRRFNIAFSWMASAHLSETNPRRLKGIVSLEIIISRQPGLCDRRLVPVISNNLQPPSWTVDLVSQPRSLVVAGSAYSVFMRGSSASHVRLNCDNVQGKDCDRDTQRWSSLVGFGAGFDC